MLNLSAVGQHTAASAPYVVELQPAPAEKAFEPGRASAASPRIWLARPTVRSQFERAEADWSVSTVMRAVGSGSGDDAAGSG